MAGLNLISRHITTLIYHSLQELALNKQVNENKIFFLQIIYVEIKYIFKKINKLENVLLDLSLTSSFDISLVCTLFLNLT